ncbi:MAG: hypothetical protein A2176_16255 [Spirochaetes bacterium RBG_13_51_14]|nr:MAG: hypothetical protein A2176_16255 [Spirochaetes bacterium RBG_13_51_14]
MMKKQQAVFLAIVIGIGFPTACRAAKQRVAIQPLGYVRQEVINCVTAGLARVYDVKAQVLPPVDIPRTSYYRPNSRYRAEKLLDYLETDRYSGYDKILGLTAFDISTSKGRIYDWGIFGLGRLSGRSCIVSTFRLTRGASAEKFFARLVKVVNHEMGHTFGLPHCPAAGCIMQDAKGTIMTVDKETGAFCEACKNRLRDLHFYKNDEKP